MGCTSGASASNGIGSPSTISCLGFSSWEVSLEVLAHSLETLSVYFCWFWSDPGALQSWDQAQSSLCMAGTSGQGHLHIWSRCQRAVPLMALGAHGTQGASSAEQEPHSELGD